MPGILRRLSRLVPLLRNGANRRVRRSERAPTQKQHLIAGAVFVLVTRMLIIRTPYLYLKAGLDL